MRLLTKVKCINRTIVVTLIPILPETKESLEFVHKY